MPDAPRRRLRLILVLVGLGAVVVIAGLAVLDVRDDVTSTVNGPEPDPRLHTLQRALPPLPAEAQKVEVGTGNPDSCEFPRPYLFETFRSLRPGPAIRDEWLNAFRADGWVEGDHTDDASGFRYTMTKPIDDWTAKIEFWVAWSPNALYNVEGRIVGVDYCPPAH